MAVRIRLKKMGRKARPFYRVCAVDSRSPRDGKVIEELGTYDPMVPETDARAILKTERVDYWLGVGAQPSHKAGVLIRKYGTEGTHLSQQKEALERLQSRRPVEVTVAATDSAAKTEEPAEQASAAEESKDSAESAESAES